MNECPGPVIRYPIDLGAPEGLAVVECCACGWIATTDGPPDHAHADTMVLAG